MARTRPPLTPALLAVVLALPVGCSSEDPAPTGYSITYEVVTSRGAATEIVEVVRHEVSRRLAGDLVTTTTQNGIYQRSGGVWRQLAVVGPGETGEDLQLTAALEWASAVGIVQRVGVSTVAGRGCTRWRTAEPLDAGPWSRATTTSETVSCVDAEGRLLSDTWRVEGTVARSRTATRVADVVVVRPFDGASPATLDPSLVTTGVTTGVEPQPDLVVLVPPAGGHLRAAADIVEVAPGTLDVTQQVHRAVYTIGEARVVLDQVHARGLAPRGLREVDLGALGTGRVTAAAGGLVFEAAVGDGLVRVRSGLAYDATVTWIRLLARR